MEAGAYSPVIADGWKPTLRNVNIRDNRISNTGGDRRGG
jgi:hypothetical protein